MDGLNYNTSVFSLYEKTLYCASLQSNTELLIFSPVNIIQNLKFKLFNK